MIPHGGQQTKGPPTTDNQGPPVTEAKETLKDSRGHVVTGLCPAVWKRNQRQPSHATPLLRGRADGSAGLGADDPERGSHEAGKTNGFPGSKTQLGCS